MKFFRKIRQRLLSENRFTKYLAYALGEIVLVIIGILIALNLNVRKEERKTAARIDAIFENVLEDLASEIRETNKTIQLQFEFDSLHYKVLNKQLTKEDYLKPGSRALFDLYQGFWIFKFTQQAYLSLTQNIDAVPEKYSEVVKDLGFLYNTNRKSVEYANSEIVRISARNKNHIADNFEWYSNPALIESEIDYRLNDYRYANAIKAIGEGKSTLLTHVISYRKKAIETYQKIAALLDKPTIHESFAINQEAASQLVGIWGITEASIPIPDEAYNDHLCFKVEDDKLWSYPSTDTTFKSEELIISFNKRKDEASLKILNLRGHIYTSLTIKGDTMVSDLKFAHLKFVKVKEGN